MEAERLQAAIDAVIERMNPDQIILFGSGARGEMTTNSDIDLLVIKERSKEDPAAWQEHWRSARGDQLDVIVMDRHTVEKHRNSAYYVQGSALEEGQSIYTRAGFAPVRTGPTYTRNGAIMAKTTRFDPSHATVLLENAERWWGYANSVEHPPDKCRMGHEAIEQALKGLIVASGRRVEHIHELNDLWNQAETGTERIAAIRDPAIMKRLTLHSGTWRYDMQDPDPTETWKLGKTTIEDVLNDARRRIPGMIDKTRTLLPTEPGQVQPDNRGDQRADDDPRSETRRIMAAHPEKLTGEPKLAGADRPARVTSTTPTKKTSKTHEH